ncbi:hypothetical protein SARC_10127 [Sphaeroforma arctica JP610]|uniref:Uncharacterized protein n=1 Tax=Sphaeroforma arctica JP610 TaxID=667725 RepID=A0A0L0FMZ6_9EUKA|nr:hypothetical protein SARC_10127 [Sphaeroforma arctica JP610]KNC77413.1 hypothetical protein SARC_10127 [Sphaeroforma arctica JP610]|eukprot:XP_014151315.1 hypothetical protein SARC_10127 [Sphaeroforma arctica JP610]
MYSQIKLSAALLLSASFVAHAGVTRRQECNSLVISIDDSISYGNSEPQNDPDSPALIITNASNVTTAGGPSSSDSKCVYFYRPDSNALADELDCEGTEEECAEEKYDGQHLYTGDVWPYIITDPECEITFDDTVADNSTLREDGFIQVDSEGVVTIGGLPIYQYPDDTAEECLCNFGPWASVGPDGASPQFEVTQRT